MLVAAGADVNARTPAGDTALHMAASMGRLEIAQLLIDQGRRDQPPEPGQRDAAAPRRRPAGRRASPCC